VLPAFPFVPAPRAIRFTRTRTQSVGRYAYSMVPGCCEYEHEYRFTEHEYEDGKELVGNDKGRWPWLLELLALWAETKGKRQKHGVVLWTGS